MKSFEVISCYSISSVLKAHLILKMSLHTREDNKLPLHLISPAVDKEGDGGRAFNSKVIDSEKTETTKNGKGGKDKAVVALSFHITHNYFHLPVSILKRKGLVGMLIAYRMYMYMIGNEIVDRTSSIEIGGLEIGWGRQLKK
jgi:hypothetical protein